MTSFATHLRLGHVAVLGLGLAAWGCDGASARDAGGAGSTEGGGAEGAIAFVGVHVVPMDEERTLEDQTVVVLDGRIERLGPRTSVDVPEDAE
ncbi:MAG: hypothetical protein R3266_12690, partial [Gemmatimonadota bacterium]|nr:hypothetical protein [Gemmatimonadota bacterium]